jgi:hypothetical protein
MVTTHDGSQSESKCQNPAISADEREKKKRERERAREREREREVRQNSLVRRFNHIQ